MEKSEGYKAELRDAIKSVEVNYHESQVGLIISEGEVNHFESEKSRLPFFMGSIGKLFWVVGLCRLLSEKGIKPDSIIENTFQYLRTSLLLIAGSSLGNLSLQEQFQMKLKEWKLNPYLKLSYTELIFQTLGLSLNEPLELIKLRLKNEFNIEIPADFIEQTAVDTIKRVISNEPILTITGSSRADKRVANYSNLQEVLYYLNLILSEQYQELGITKDFNDAIVKALTNVADPVIEINKYVNSYQIIDIKGKAGWVPIFDTKLFPHYLLQQYNIYTDKYLFVDVYSYVCRATRKDGRNFDLAVFAVLPHSTDNDESRLKVKIDLFNSIYEPVIKYLVKL